MKAGVHVFELTTTELMVLVRRLKRARTLDGGLGPTECQLLNRFELELPAALRPSPVLPFEELPSLFGDE